MKHALEGQPTGRRENPLLSAMSPCRRMLLAALATMLATALTTGVAMPKDMASQGRSELGAVPAFHPELGLGALQGYLDPKTLPNSIALIPPPPAPGSAAFAHDEEVARATFGLRDTPRFALAVSDFELKLPKLPMISLAR